MVGDDLAKLAGMKPKLKPIEEQVMVITGASSGIGLATARLAAEKGAMVVLSSRNEDDLRQAVKEIEDQGGHADCIVADVGFDDDVQKIADFAIHKFGRVDTWVNNAGASVYGKLVDIPMAEKRRLFDTNFWGVVHGCKAAVRLMREKGGAIINIGSEASEHPLPLQGIYAASKHAEKAYTDALRMELEKDGIPISVTLVKPAAINTPFTEHADSRMEAQPELPPPVYSPELVARTIITCAQKPVPSIYVGGSAFMFANMSKFFPRLSERLSEMMFIDKQKATQPKRRDEGLMKVPQHEGRTHGDSPYPEHQTSLYTNVALHPAAAAAVAAGVGVAALAGVRGLQNRKKAA